MPLSRDRAAAVGSDGRFVMIPLGLVNDLRVSPEAKLAFCVLLDVERNRLAKISLPGVAKRLGCHVNTAERIMRSLRLTGWVEVAEDRKGCCRVYRLLTTADCGRNKALTTTTNGEGAPGELSADERAASEAARQRFLDENRQRFGRTPTTDGDGSTPKTPTTGGDGSEPTPTICDAEPPQSALKTPTTGGGLSKRSLDLYPDNAREEKNAGDDARTDHDAKTRSDLLDLLAKVVNEGDDVELDLIADDLLKRYATSYLRALLFARLTAAIADPRFSSLSERLAHAEERAALKVPA